MATGRRTDRGLISESYGGSGPRAAVEAADGAESRPVAPTGVSYPSAVGSREDLRSTSVRPSRAGGSSSRAGPARSARGWCAGSSSSTRASSASSGATRPSSSTSGLEYRDQSHVRFLIGDIRDRDRLVGAAEDIDIVFHCAALKHVESGEYNPFEATQTNVVGTQNVIDALPRGRRPHDDPDLVRQGRQPDLGDGREQAAGREAGHRRHQLPRPPPDHLRQRPLRQRARIARDRRSSCSPRQVAAGGPVTVTDPR